VAQHGITQHVGRDGFAVQAREDPRVADRSAGNHHAVSAGVSFDSLDIRDGLHITVCDNRDRNSLLHLGNCIPVGLTGIALLLRPSMHGDELPAVLFDDSCNLQIVARIVIPTQANFAGHGDIEFFAQARENPGNLLRGSQQSSAGPAP